MWIERLEVEGFRRLSGTFEFSPSVTVVVGDNEAGKSTLHDALLRTLFGFSKSERRRSGGQSPLERRLPWDGKPFRTIASIRDGGRALRIEWDFSAHRVQVVDELGRDVSGEALGKGDEVRLGEYLLGIGIDDFRQVCCIDQDSLLAVRNSPSLGVALQEAVANVAGDTPVEDAVEALNDFLRSTVGARVDNLNPSPTGRLSTLGRERAGLQAELEAAEAAREELVTVSRERAKARQERDALVEESEAVRRAQLHADVRNAEERLAEARRLAAAAAVQPDQAAFDPRAVDGVKAARERLAELHHDSERAGPDAAAATASIEGLEVEQRELVAAVDGLAPYSSIDTAARASVQTAWAQLEAVRGEQAASPGIPASDPVLARYRAERSELQALAAQQSSSKLRRFSWITLVVLTIGLAWLARKLVRKLRGVRPGTLEERLAPYGGSLESLEASAAEEDRALAAAEAVVEAFRSREAAGEVRRRELTTEIEAELDAARAPAAPLEERVRAYLAAVERHAEWTKRQADLERVRRQIAELRRPLDELARLGVERQRAEAQLGEALGALGIVEADLERAFESFDRALAAAARGAMQARAADNAAAALRTLLGDETIESLEAEIPPAQRLYDEHRVAHGELGEAAADGVAAAQKLAQMEQTIRSGVECVTELETRAAQLEEQAGDPAAIKERVAEIDEQLARLDEAKQAVALARATLGEAAGELRREFAPHLNRALERNLARITGGRYAEAMVDADLSVRVVVPETRKVQSADDLSRATNDQIFLVQRLEIARLLAPTKGKAPLLLDDLFAHYDAGRLRYGLEVVSEAAEERQIVVFSEDRELAELAVEFCGSCRVIELDPPPAA